MLLLAVDPVLIAAAIIPAIVLLIKVYQADRIEKEPPALLLSLVLYGIVATGLAMVTEMVGSALVGIVLAEGSVLYNAVFYFAVVAISEEGFKYLLLKRRTWRSPAFNYQFDGVVYAVFVSLGFALWENIGYVATYGFQVALLRAVTAIPAMPALGFLWGLGMERRKNMRSWAMLKNQNAIGVWRFGCQLFCMAATILSLLWSRRSAHGCLLHL